MLPCRHPLAAARRSAAQEQTPALTEISGRLASRRTNDIPLNGYLPAAVALPLVATQGGMAILFTVRTAEVEHHKGEISFPGGRADPGDADSLATALRETWEEVGICPQDLTVLGRLDDIVSVTGYRVTPHVVALADADYAFRPEPREVERILLVPLAHLLNPVNYGVAEGWHGGLIHRFRWGEHEIWGMTAAILKAFFDIAFGFGEGS